MQLSMSTWMKSCRKYILRLMRKSTKLMVFCRRFMKCGRRLQPIRFAAPRMRSLTRFSILSIWTSPVYLTGKAGTGKNVICQQVAEALGLDFYFTNAVTQEYKLTGFIDANGNYQETQFYKAFTKGGLFFLDEMDASIPETLIILNAAIANRYFDFPNGKVSANPNFRVIAAGNTVGTGADNNYTGRYCLDRASLDRFAMVNIDYSKKIEMAMANNNKNLVSFCHRFREITDKAGIECLFSYRTIDRIAKLETVISNLSEVLSISLLKGMDEDTLSILKNELSEAKDMTNNKYAKAIINGNSWDF